MLLSQITDFLEKKIAPKSFAFINDIHGIQFGPKFEDRNIKKIMITLDPSLNTIIEGVKQKVSLIISHHGLIHTPTKHFHENLIKKFYLLSSARIILFVINTAFEAAQNGISEIIANRLSLKIENLFELKDTSGKEIPLGRICTPERYLNNTKPFLLEDLINRIKKNLNLRYIKYIGELDDEINKICIIENVSMNSLLNALKLNCDCMLTRDTQYETALIARDLNLDLILTPHFNSEIIGMKELYKILSIEFPRDFFIFFDSNDPFSYAI